MIVAPEIGEPPKHAIRPEAAGGPEGWTTDYLAGARYVKTGTETFPFPQAFSVEKRAHTVLRPHFHDENQFQVFVSGGGNIGRHAVAAYTVHYASRQTGYGPIVAGPEGIKYFTLRQMADEGAHYLPESREHQDRDAPKRSLTSDPVTARGAAHLAGLAGPETETLLAPQPDGLAAWRICLPPRASVASPKGDVAGPHNDANGGGRFYLVMQGALRMGERRFPAVTPVYATVEESAVELAAEADGLEVLVMQFPREIRAQR